MDLRALGSTDLLVSPIGIGLAALGRPGHINIDHANDIDGDYDVALLQSRAHRVRDVAYRGGVRYFDAARSHRRAGQFLSTWLRSRDRVRSSNRPSHTGRRAATWPRIEGGVSVPTQGG